MSRHLSIQELARVMVPRGLSGRFHMLTAYFDDSGTHLDSDVVLMAGLVGTEPQWKQLEAQWAAKLNAPSPGKPPLNRFHMVECQSARGEFLGWGRVATDFLVKELQDIIIQTGVLGYACAVSRKDWAEFINGDLLAMLGDAEGFCVRMCFDRVVNEIEGDTAVALVFDDRPGRLEGNKRIFQAYVSAFKDGQVPIEPVSVTFASSRELIPLQAADMVAWEAYQQACDFLTGENTESFVRDQFKRLASGIPLRAQIANRDAVKKIAATEAKYKNLKEMADFFRDVD